MENLSNSFYETLDKNTTIKVLTETLKGADDGELFFEDAISEILVWDEGKIKTANYDKNKGFGLRRVDGEVVSFAHSSEITDDAFLTASNAVKAGGSGESNRVFDVAPHKVSLDPMYVGNNPMDLYEFNKKVELLKNLDTYAKDKANNIVQVSASLSAHYSKIHILRSDNVDLADVKPRCMLRVSIILKDDNGRMESGSHSLGRYTYKEIFSDTTWKHAVDEAIRQANVNLVSIPAPAGQFDVVLGPGWPGVMLHEAVGHGLEGDFIRKKTSVFADKLGLQVAAKGVSVIDDGTIIGNRFGSFSFDDEGTPSQKTTLIKDGELMGFMYDRQNGRLDNKKSTGNGRRQSYAYVPQVRMTNTYMEAGPHEEKDMIANVKNGIYAVSFGGGQVDTVSGKFVFSCTEAYKIENGEIKESLKGATLIGSGIEAMNKIAMVGNNLELDENIGTCGKGGQGVAVGIGQPSILMQNITIGGTE